MNWAIDILPYILDLAGIGLTALIGVAVKWLMQKTKNTAVNQALQVAEGLADSVILEIKQTLVDDLKKRGRFTRETARQVKTAAAHRLKIQIKKELKTLSKSMGDKGDSFLRSLIESAVHRSKQ